MAVQSPENARSWQQPKYMLYLMSAAVPLSFATWQALLNNFAIERAQFTGAEIGILQSLREVPGLLAFTVVLVLLMVREQRLAVIALLALGIGTALTGFFPSEYGLYATTILMSVGYHYYETLNQSLALQWLPKKEAPQTLGRIIAIASFAGLVAYGLIFLTFKTLHVDFRWVYLAGGGLTVIIALIAWLGFPKFREDVPQTRKLFLRKRYWLYYVLVFLSGARRQIFVVFAGFMMVEKFGYTVGDIAMLFLLNGAINMVAAPRIGKLIAQWGERRALIIEYAGLILIFSAYALVENATWAAVLYVLDHLFFAMAIALKTYFQKIADPADIASTAGVSFSINHVAAVAIPAAFGLLYMVSPAAVFVAGALIAVASLLCALNIPTRPEPGNEVLRGHRGAQGGPSAAPAAAE